MSGFTNLQTDIDVSVIENFVSAEVFDIVKVSGRARGENSVTRPVVLLA